jgi:hypothetical protein
LVVFADLGIVEAVLDNGHLGIVMRAYHGDAVVWHLRIPAVIGGA